MDMSLLPGIVMRTVGYGGIGVSLSPSSCFGLSVRFDGGVRALETR